MTPAEILEKYSSMFALAEREGLPLLEETADYTRVVLRIKGVLERARDGQEGKSLQDDIAELGKIAQLFREQKARQAA